MHGTHRVGPSARDLVSIAALMACFAAATGCGDDAGGGGVGGGAGGGAGGGTGDGGCTGASCVHSGADAGKAHADGGLADAGDADAGGPDGGLGDGGLDQDGGLTPPPDADGDGIPDGDDPFPMDPDLPGAAHANVVYAHTSSGLFTMDPSTYEILPVGTFSFDQSAGQVTDIAIDRFGVLYAVTFNDLFVCHPATAACHYLGDLPQSFNGLTLVPPGTFDPDDDTLIGIANSGSWYVITVVAQQAQLLPIGSYGNNMTSAGDVFSIEGTGTFGAVNKPGVNDGNVIVRCDPTNGSVVEEVATAVGYTTIYGLAGWQNQIFAFESDGDVVEIDPSSGQVTLVASTIRAWWGAGVYTVLPPSGAGN